MRDGHIRVARTADIQRGYSRVGLFLHYTRRTGSGYAPPVLPVQVPRVDGLPFKVFTPSGLRPHPRAERIGSSREFAPIRNAVAVRIREKRRGTVDTRLQRIGNAVRVAVARSVRDQIENRADTLKLF